MEQLEKAEDLIKEFGKFAPKVVDEIINGLDGMYIYDNSETYETRKDEIKWWKKVKKLTKT